MFKLIPVILSLAIMGVGGAAISVENYNNNNANVNLQNYMRANNNVISNLQNTSDLFLKGNTNPNL